MVTHNILKDLIVGYLKFGGDLFSFSYNHLTHILGFNDFGLGLLITTVTFSYIVFSIVIKFAPIFSTIKATMVTTGIVMFWGSFFYITDRGTPIEQINQAIKTSGVVWIIYMTIITIQLLMSVPYFKGLFGRFKDSLEN